MNVKNQFVVFSIFHPWLSVVTCTCLVSTCIW